MDKTSSRTAAAAAGADPQMQSPGPAMADEAPASSALMVTLACLIRVAALALVSCSLARAAWRVRGEAWDLAFIAGASADLAALFWCIRRAERLPPSSEGEERRRLQLAVWALSTVLSCAFAYRVSLMMPTATLVIVVWGMTLFVVLVGFCLLVVCTDHRGYRVLEDSGDAGDGKATDKKISAADELV